MRLIVEKQFFNTTYLVHDQKKLGLNAIIACLLENGISPRVIGSSYPMSVEVPDIGIRFINSENYFDLAAAEEMISGDQKKIFFPQKWNKPAKFYYEGEPPLEEDFFDFADTEEKVLEKKKFVRFQSYPWNFAENLIKYSQNECQRIAKATTGFVFNSLICQEKLKTCLTTLPNNHVNLFAHPFNYPLFTKAAYAFKLLLLFCPKLRSVKVVKPAISMASSKGEVEFCSFLRWKYPQLEFQDAWSISGQKRFLEAFPDSFCKSTKT